VAIIIAVQTVMAGDGGAGECEALSGRMKWCRGCGRAGAWRPVEQFGTDRTKADGYRSRCRACRLGKSEAVVQPAAGGQLPLQRARAARRLAWTVECLACGGYEEVRRYPGPGLYCWRDRSRLLLGREWLYGNEAELKGWGSGGMEGVRWSC